MVDEPRSEILIRYSNDTHVIDNITCGWYEKTNHIPVIKNIENKVLEKLQQESAYITFYDSYPNANETIYYHEETGTSSITLDVENSKNNNRLELELTYHADNDQFVIIADCDTGMGDGESWIEGRTSVLEYILNNDCVQ